MFGGPYLQREIYVSKSIGLAYSWKEFSATLYLRAISKYKPPGGAYNYLAYFRNFKVYVLFTGRWVWSYRQCARKSSIIC